jgi:hypothetical protein
MLYCRMSIRKLTYLLHPNAIDSARFRQISRRGYVNIDDVGTKAFGEFFRLGQEKRSALVAV